MPGEPDHDALIERIREAEFSTTRGGSNYAMGHVDDFLDGMVVTLQQGRAIEPLIAMVRFATVRLRVGYVTAEVDEFLEAIAAESTGARPPAPHSRNEDPSEVEPAPLPSVIEEPKGMLAKMLGR